MAELIAYLRVSTKAQGASGLGLEGQRAAVEAYARQTGSKVCQWYTEIESGKKADRVELARALAHAKRSKATLVVAKLDRLARNVEFLAKVMNSGADFVACDNPAANRLTLHILSAVAEAEAKAISDRTKAALAAARQRGAKLGSNRPGHWDGKEDARKAGALAGSKVASKVNHQAAVEAYSDLMPTIKELSGEGKSLREIASQLNQAGHKTRRGKEWNPMQIKRLLAR